MTKESENNGSAARGKGIYLLPNMLTTAALFAGFYAIVAAVDGNFGNSAVAIFIAMALDGLDGRVARMTSTESDFGKEYDSLSDMVSFGLAPSIVVYQWGLARLAEYGWAWGKLGWLAAFFYTAAAALRLARFNTRVGIADKRYFEGLPSPSAAGVVAAMVWLSYDLELSGLTALALAFFITAAAGALMVSTFKYYSFKDINMGGKVPFPTLLLIPAIFMLIAVNPPLVLFCLFGGFASVGPLFWLIRRNRKRSPPTDSEE